MNHELIDVVAMIPILAGLILMSGLLLPFAVIVVSCLRGARRG